MSQSGLSLMFQPLAKYFEFEGRARRSEYWLWVLFLVLANAALTAVQFSFIGRNSINIGMGVIVVIKILFGLGMIIPTFSVSVRRMHDSNRTGWWTILPTTVFFISAIVYFSLNGVAFMGEMENMRNLSETSENPTAIAAAVMTIMRPLIWILVPTMLAKLVTFVFRVLDGTPGPNRFGPDPKGRGGNANIF